MEVLGGHLEVLGGHLEVLSAQLVATNGYSDIARGNPEAPIAIHRVGKKHNSLKKSKKAG